jgi:NAD+ synthase
MNNGKSVPALSPDVLRIDPHREISTIVERLREIVAKTLHKRGLVVAMSGGIDSSVCAALAVEAVGPKRVFGLLLPERDSSADSTRDGRKLAEQLGVTYELQDIAPTLDAIGCYAWRDRAIKTVFPQYNTHWKNKIVIAGGREGGYNYFRLVVQSPDGAQEEKRLDLKQYLQIVAATSYKQRIRKTIEYFHADRLNYAVTGTPNRLEYDQGFFVRNGDGSADVKPIAHLYKTQVFELGRALSLPPTVLDAVPTTDTYSLAQGQDEFYFGLAYPQMDLALWAFNHDYPAALLAASLGVPVSTAEAIYQDIVTKRRTTRSLHFRPVLVADVAGIG